jgi:hypothetical protein
MPRGPAYGDLRSPGLIRAGLVLLAIPSAAIAAWSLTSPHGFYRDFPGLGRHWVSALPPYNEHLLRDFGATNLALSVVMLVAFLRPTVTLVRLAAFSSLVWQAPHTLYHLVHVDSLPALGDQVAQSATLLLGVVVALGLLWDAGNLERPVAAAPVPANAAPHPTRGVA